MGLIRHAGDITITCKGR